MLFTMPGLFAQNPTASALVNAASMVPTALPNSNIAPGSLFVIFGTNLGPATLVQAGLPLPAASGLAGTSVQITSGNFTAQAPILYTSSNQVAAILPSRTPAGSGTVTVTYKGLTGAGLPIQVTPASFGIFTLPQNGLGAAAATFSDYSLVSPTHSAKPGDIITLWGTGLGPIAGDDAGMPPVGDLSTPVQVYVGSQTATVAYHGRAGCCAGLDQINLVVPTGTEGCSVPVSVDTAGTTSNFPSISIAANGGVCSAPYSPQFIPELTALQSKGSINAGFLDVDRITDIQDGDSAVMLDVGEGAFFPYTADLLIQRQVPVSVPSCSVGWFKLTDFTAASPPLNQGGLNGGPTIQVTGPAGDRTMQMVPNVPEISDGPYSGFYSGQLGSGDYLSPGAYTLSNGTGGSDVGGFSATVTVPPPFTWTNEASFFAIDRSQPLTVTWTGGDPNGTVTVLGYSYVNSTLASSFSCVAPASAGQFTVPARILQATAPSVVGPNSNVLAVTSYSQMLPFTAPGLDFGIIEFITVFNNVNPIFY